MTHSELTLLIAACGFAILFSSLFDRFWQHIKHLNHQINHDIYPELKKRKSKRLKK